MRKNCLGPQASLDSVGIKYFLMNVSGEDLNPLSTMFIIVTRFDHAKEKAILRTPCARGFEFGISTDTTLPNQEPSLAALSGLPKKRTQKNIISMILRSSRLYVIFQSNYWAESHFFSKAWNRNRLREFWSE